MGRHGNGQDKRQAGADDLRTRRTRVRWTAPRIADHGSLTHMVRGSTGFRGDKGSPVGRRP
jgi:hypothetical protein